MSINLHLLRIFATVAECGGFSRAAEVLHISQPAISRGVRELEDQLDLALVDRTGRRFRLSAAGERLLVQARRLFQVEKSLEQELGELKSLETGRLRIGASQTVATYCLPPVIGRFHRAAPDIDLRLEVGNTQKICDLLLAGEIDVALVEGTVDPLHFDSVSWRHDDLVLVAAPSHPLANRLTPLDADELAGQLFLMREPGSGTREMALAALARVGVEPSRLMEVNSGEAIVRIVAAGIGIGMLSQFIAANHLSLGLVRVLAVPGLAARRELLRVAVKGHRPSPAEKAFDRVMACEED